MHDSLAPGPSLEVTTQAMLKSVTSLLDSMDDVKGNEIGLFDWVQKVVTRASTDAIYGPEGNPFKDPAVYGGFWYF